jgi:hypothetical protein
VTGAGFSGFRGRAGARVVAQKFVWGVRKHSVQTQYVESFLAVFHEVRLGVGEHNLVGDADAGEKRTVDGGRKELRSGFPAKKTRFSMILAYLLGMVPVAPCLAWSGAGFTAPPGRLVDRSYGTVAAGQSRDGLVRRIEGATGSQERHDNDATPRIAGGSQKRSSGNTIVSKRGNGARRRSMHSVAGGTRCWPGRRGCLRLTDHLLHRLLLWN